MDLADLLKPVLEAVPQQPQTQAALSDQLRVLQAFANRLGLYDAADCVARSLPSINKNEN
jgi:hypothetical protein